jgi:hypothetical protein
VAEFFFNDLVVEFVVVAGGARGARDFHTRPRSNLPCARRLIAPWP